MNLKDARLAVIGLGYVGPPLAVEFAYKIPVIVFDINPTRVQQLNEGVDHTKEVGPEELANARHLTVTDDPSALDEANVFIVTAPTRKQKLRRRSFACLANACNA